MLFKVIKRLKLKQKRRELGGKFIGIVVLPIVVVELLFPHLTQAQALAQAKTPSPEETIIKAAPRGMALPQELVVPVYKVQRTFFVVTTAYSSTPDQTDSTPFITASGTQVREGVVAANFLRIGTLVRFPEVSGEKVFVVEDRMHPRYWHRVDIWMPTRVQAKQFGLQYLKVEVVEEV